MTNEKIDSLIPEDVEILHDLVYSFPYVEQEFAIEYSTLNKEWYAYHYDVEKYEDRLILESKNIKFSVDTLLFNVYYLTIEEFEKLKEYVIEDMKNNDTNNI